MTQTTTRSVIKSVRGMATSDGAGVKLTRVIGTPLLRRLDPFLMLDEFRSDEPKDYLAGFPDHPHRGFETFTYMLAGKFRHRDNKGHEGLLGAGGGQWMTAGRGIVHAETPVPQSEDEFTLHGIQLWTSLPRASKLTAPRYQNLTADSIAEVSAKGAHARVIAGELGDAKGPASTLMPTFLWHVRIDPGATFESPIADGHEAAVYVIDGRAVVGEGTQASTGELAVLDGTTGGLRVQNAAAAPLEVMVLGGAPAEGPLVFHGPFVMNSVDQVRAAEIAYRTGRMGSLD